MLQIYFYFLMFFVVCSLYRLIIVLIYELRVTHTHTLLGSALRCENNFWYYGIDYDTGLEQYNEKTEIIRYTIFKVFYGISFNKIISNYRYTGICTVYRKYRQLYCMTCRRSPSANKRISFS